VISGQDERVSETHEIAVDEGFRDAVLAWAEEHRRTLPWRETRDPWWVLVSEVMLQQTSVARVQPKYEEFVVVWPTPRACAAAELGDVLRLWSGLGYPRRARNLHAVARRICALHDGRVPRDLDALLQLPGVGPYTARAVLTFAYEDDVGVVDTNVGRLFARWSGRSYRPAEAQLHADRLVPNAKSWAWNQGLFDLAAAVCTKRQPRCAECPVSPWCEWRGRDDAADPAVGSAAVSGPQSSFEGSDRQLRGMLLRQLESAAATRAELAATVEVSSDRAERLIESLVADGLVSRREDLYSLG